MSKYKQYLVALLMSFALVTASGQDFNREKYLLGEQAFQDRNTMIAWGTFSGVLLANHILMNSRHSSTKPDSFYIVGAMPFTISLGFSAGALALHLQNKSRIKYYKKYRGKGLDL